MPPVRTSLSIPAARGTYVKLGGSTSPSSPRSVRGRRRQPPAPLSVGFQRSLQPAKSTYTQRPPRPATLSGRAQVRGRGTTVDTKPPLETYLRQQAAVAAGGLPPRPDWLSEDAKRAWRLLWLGRGSEHFRGGVVRGADREEGALPALALSLLWLGRGRLRAPGRGVAVLPRRLRRRQ